MKELFQRPRVGPGTIGGFRAKKLTKSSPTAEIGRCQKNGVVKGSDGVREVAGFLIGFRQAEGERDLVGDVDGGVEQSLECFDRHSPIVALERNLMEPFKGAGV